VFDIGPEKLLVLLAAVFFILGPKELPNAARQIGTALHRLRSLQDAVRSELNTVLSEADQTSELALAHEDPNGLRPEDGDSFT
jgi:Sec-independent protein translocase protein TatA